jgi:hypothetical protein
MPVSMKLNVVHVAVLLDLLHRCMTSRPPMQLCCLLLLMHWQSLLHPSPFACSKRNPRCGIGAAAHQIG